MTNRRKDSSGDCQICDQECARAGFFGKEKLKNVHDQENMSYIYINEYLPKFPAKLAPDGRALRDTGLITDAWKEHWISI